jgi:hypothetical protein
MRGGSCVWTTLSFPMNGITNSGNPTVLPLPPSQSTVGLHPNAAIHRSLHTRRNRVRLGRKVEDVNFVVGVGTLGVGATALLGAARAEGLPPLPPLTSRDGWRVAARYA